MAVVSGYYRADDLISFEGDEKQIGLCHDFGWNRDFGGVPRRIVGKGFLPERLDAREMVGAVTRDVEVAHRSVRFRHPGEPSRV